MQVFPSKIDLWLLLLLIAVAAFCLYSSVGALRSGDWLSALMVLLMGAGLPLWLLLSTRYLVSEEQLIVRSGPFIWRIELASITNVEDSSNPVSSPALSLDRLAVHYNNGSQILLSPREKEAFRAAIGQ